MREQAVKDLEKEFLEPAFKYLMENGLENTSVRDLCKAMGISSGGIYYWFENKDDVFISTVKYGLHKAFDEIFKIAVDRMLTPEIFIDTFFDGIEKYKAEIRLILQVDIRQRNEGRRRNFQNSV